MRWQHLLALQILPVDLCNAKVTDRTALPQNRAEMLIGFQANHKIKIYFYKIILLKVFNVKFTQTNTILQVVYEAQMMAGLHRFCEAAAFFSTSCKSMTNSTVSSMFNQPG